MNLKKKALKIEDALKSVGSIRKTVYSFYASW